MSHNTPGGFVCAGVLRIAVTLTIASSAGSSLDSGVTLVRAQGAAAQIHVWAAVTVSSPVLSTTEQVNVTFAATNLGTEPIPRTSVREDTVLVVNGEAWPDSAFIFGNGIHSTEKMLAPGKSQVFLYQLTNRFSKPGVYRLVWKGKGFESLPFEFRVAEQPF